MSDLQVQPSPTPSTSPASNRISRPHFPWTTYSSQTIMHPVRPGSATRSWDPRTAAGVHTPSASWTASRPGSSYNALNATVVPNDETTRHWSFTAFEWVVRDISRLKLFVEDGETTERVEGAQGPATRNDDFEILRESPMMGDGKFKLEIDYGQYETSASMMTAIKCQGERSGERGARAEWVWEHWQERWTFQPDNEVWECPLPTLSELWANPRIQETNSFVICVQIHSPVGPYIPQQPAAFYVPRDLLEGLEASLDNANTGDVRFVCLERLSHPLLSPRRPASAASTASHSPFSTQLTARKRVIYAHSDIISRRSDYFATMLASSFSEAGPGSVSGERKVYNITVEEADFETIYWLLKWVYGNWLLFKENDDPRVAVEGVGEGWSARWLNARGGEWDWKTFMKSNFSDGSIAGGKDDARSVTSGDIHAHHAGHPVVVELRLSLTMLSLRPAVVPHAWRRVSLRGLASLASDVKSNATFRIPLIDFSKYREATSLSEKRKTADEIVNGFKEVGFVYLGNHGIPADTVERVFEKSANFFRLPMDAKSKLAWEDPRANRGYVQVGRERVTQSADAAEIAALRAQAPDFKETMEIGRDWDTTWKNQWPQESEVPQFKSTMLDFFRTCHELHTVVMRSIAVGLDLDEMFFEDKVNEQSHNLRLLSYPSIRTSLLRGDGQARAGAHSDYGTLTLLFQDHVGGLEVQNPQTKDFQPAPPIPGTIVVNAGDLMARWSNDVLRSTLHRVVAPPALKISETESLTPARQSIAFFCNPNFTTRISCLPNCGSQPKYEPVTTEEYIVGRLAATYT
ncbi:hypothetical protein HWV62_23066 [Athelia sp. TMB]|nr:hypothetical protein HWV62_23066 [Athelia sp. TMB]